MTCVVLCFHRVLPEGAGGFLGDCHRVRGTVVSLATFEKQITDIARHYAPVDLGDFVAALEGRATLPPKACLITFDDGYRDFAEHALPVLERQSFPCTLFVTAEQARAPQPLAPPDAWYATLATSRMPFEELKHRILGPAMREHDYARPHEQPGLRVRLVQDVGAVPQPEPAPGLYLSERELPALRAHGVTLGSHGWTHHACTVLTDAMLASGLRGSRSWLESLAPGTPATLAYPFGKADDRVARAAAEAGFRGAFTVRPCRGDEVGSSFFVARSCVPDRSSAVEELIAGGTLSIP